MCVEMNEEFWNSFENEQTRKFFQDTIYKL